MKHELLPQGADVIDGGVRYRVWAPEKREVEVEVIDLDTGNRRTLPLGLDATGYHHGIDEQGRAGDGYQIRLDGAGPFPDPGSRWQPKGVHGPSMVIDPRAYRWR